jgi:CBS domain-containing protein
MTIREALAFIATHPFNSFPLLGADGKCPGVINQAQLYDALRGGALTLDTALSQLEPIELPSVAADARVVDAVETFCRTGRNKILVVDGENRLQGILTPVDLLAGKSAGRVPE